MQQAEDSYGGKYDVKKSNTVMLPVEIICDDILNTGLFVVHPYKSENRSIYFLIHPFWLDVMFLACNYRGVT